MDAFEFMVHAWKWGSRIILKKKNMKQSYEMEGDERIAE